MAGLGTLLLLGLLAGLDNLQVGAGLGLAGMRPARRLALAAAFLLCETGTPLAGLAFGRLVQRIAGPLAEGIGSAVLALCGAVIVAAALSGREDEAAARNRQRSVDGPLVLVALPLSLSCDNLFVGLGLGSLGFPVAVSALVIGGISGGLGCAGLFAGARLRRFVPARAELLSLLSGAYLVALALFRLWKGFA